MRTRTRDWRRYKQEVILRKRLKNFSYKHRWRIRIPSSTIKGYYYPSTWMDYIGEWEYKFFKSHATANYDSKDKKKYSPNKSLSGNRSYYGHERKKMRESCGTREGDKMEFLKILKENGLR